MYLADAFIQSDLQMLSPGRECRVGNEILPQVEEFKYLGVLFTSEGRMEREIDGGLVQRLQCCGLCSDPSL